MSVSKLLLFGGFRLININSETLNPGSRKAKALLAWLAVNPDQQHPREKLAAVLWPDSDEAQGRHSLRQALAELRKVFPDDKGPLHSTKEWITLDSQQVEVDIHRFNHLMTRTDTDALDQAIELYKGEFLEGCNPHSDSFDEWLSTYRADFSIRTASALEQRLETLLEGKNHEQACYFAVRLLSIDPLREQAYRTLIQAHAEQGNQAAALRWYRRCQTVLQHELGIPPDQATQSLYSTLFDSKTLPVTPSLPVPPGITSGSKSCSTRPQKTASTKQRLLYVVETAINGILDHIGGQGFLVRGEHAAEKAALLEEVTILVSSHGFSCCRRQVPDFANANDDVTVHKLIDGSSSCLAKQPVLLVVEDIHLANTATLKLLAELIAVAGNGGILLVMTSCFDGEPLDPLWRGAMCGAPLTTIDL